MSSSGIVAYLSTRERLRTQESSLPARLLMVTLLGGGAGGARSFKQQLKASNQQNSSKPNKASNSQHSSINKPGGALVGIVTVNAKLCFVKSPAQPLPSWAAAKAIQVSGVVQNESVTFLPLRAHKATYSRTKHGWPSLPRLYAG